TATRGRETVDTTGLCQPTRPGHAVAPSGIPGQWRCARLTSSTRLEAGDSPVTRRIFLLRRRLPVREASVGSYIGSTGVLSLRQPGGENITRGVDIPVMSCAASARPFPHVQVHPCGDPATCGAHLARRKPAVDRQQVTPVPAAFVLEH